MWVKLSQPREGGGGVRLDTTAYRKALRYWVDFAKQNGGGSDNYARYAQLEAQWPNLEAATATLRDLAGITDATGEGRALRDADAARLLNELADAISHFLHFRGYWGERVRLGTWAYAGNLALGAWSQAGWRANDVAWSHYSRGETDQAATWAGRMATAMTRGGTRYGQAVATQLQGLVARQRQQWDEATRLYQTALAAYRELKAEQPQTIVLNSLGEVARAQRAYDQADAYYRQALALAEKSGYVEGQATYTGNLGALALDRDRPAEARPWYERSLALAQQLGRQDQIAEAQDGVAQVLESEGRYGEALAQAQAALQIYERLGDQRLTGTRNLVARLRQKVG